MYIYIYIHCIYIHTHTHTHTHTYHPCPPKLRAISKSLVTRCHKKKSKFPITQTK